MYYVTYYSRYLHQINQIKSRYKTTLYNYLGTYISPDHLHLLSKIKMKVIETFKLKVLV